MGNAHPTGSFTIATTPPMNTISLGEFDLAVEDRGAGRMLLLVHGFPLDHTLWRHQLDYFSNRYRVIAPDLRGFGASVAAAVAGRQRDRDRAICRRSRSVARSAGGARADCFLRPVDGRLHRLAILAEARGTPRRPGGLRHAATVADSAEAAAGREMLSRRVLAEGVSVAAEAMLPRLFDDAMRAEHPQCVRETREMMARATPAGVAAALRGMAIRPNIIPGMLAEIAIPTLVIVGEHDVISPVEEMRGIAATIPAAEFQVIPHAGHMSPLENPTAFNTALDGFLTRRLRW